MTVDDHAEPPPLEFVQARGRRIQESWTAEVSQPGTSNVQTAEMASDKEATAKIDGDVDPSALDDKRLEKQGNAVSGSGQTSATDLSGDAASSAVQTPATNLSGDAANTSAASASATIPTGKTIGDRTVTCMHCFQDTPLVNCRQRGKSTNPTFRCKTCHSKVTMLTRHFGCWPPPGYGQLSPDQMQELGDVHSQFSGAGAAAVTAARRWLMVSSMQP